MPSAHRQVPTSESRISISCRHGEKGKQSRLQGSIYPLTPGKAERKNRGRTDREEYMGDGFEDMDRTVREWTRRRARTKSRSWPLRREVLPKRLGTGLVVYAAQ